MYTVFSKYMCFDKNWHFNRFN